MTQQPDEYARTHLAHELEYMLIAATTWAACHKDKRRHWPRHLVATAEYAAFVHQRSLYELFCDSGGARDTRHFLGNAKALKSTLYDKWDDDLNTAVMHYRKRGRAAPPVIGGDHLKDQVADFAHDLVRLWKEFEGVALDSVSTEMCAIRIEVLRKTSDAAIAMGTPPLHWSDDDPFAAWGDRKWWPEG